MKLQHKIIKHLIENKDSEFSIRQISINLKVDYKNTYDAVQKAKESIQISRVSNASYLKFKPILTKDVFIVENIRKEQLLQNNKIRLISDDLNNLDNPLFIAVVFGSYAKHKNSRHSDIDLCIIHDNDKEFKKIYSRLSIHPRVEILGFTYLEFMSMLRSKVSNVGHEIVRHGIAIHNIQSYYELIKHG